MCFQFVSVLDVFYWEKCQLSEFGPDIIFDNIDDEGSDAIEKKYYDSDGKFRWEGDSSGSDSDNKEELSESEVEYSDELSGVWSLDEDEAEEQ